MKWTREEVSFKAQPYFIKYDFGCIKIKVLKFKKVHVTLCQPPLRASGIVWMKEILGTKFWEPLSWFFILRTTIYFPSGLTCRSCTTASRTWPPNWRIISKPSSFRSKRWTSTRSIQSNLIKNLLQIFTITIFPNRTVYPQVVDEVLRQLQLHRGGRHRVRQSPHQHLRLVEEDQLGEI